ncbi:protein-L-isoaspartate(D-aspartate) O-methyltransferase [Oceanibacterium hippocampi]|uniref:Protein-L-isoaspartate O-methyltransferase n=1 Tax=Oceanibacterium hippocampi TaxID=745714 RepID=A0A1Y5U4Q7_9PROT|nr:protein-L-isoaspartate(D-aspartate) O-methyltransferase [Oceanibacterium hippocampi]SLN77208.1 Protein-L-isoaspartate O-methyltransferase [Oceanibacterium hippocampi]
MSENAQKIRLIMDLRRQGINDTDVLSAIERVPREQFVAPAFRDQAYENIALPISQGQTISQPYVVAFMTQALKLDKRMKVLEIGTGSGYQAAILARLCRRVYTIERYRSLHREAVERFQALRITNIVAKVGDGSKGWPEQAPLDRIILTAATETIPDALLDQLGEGGILLAPVGQSQKQQEIVRISRDDDGRFSEEFLLPVRFVPLVGGVAQ